MRAAAKSIVSRVASFVGPALASQALQTMLFNAVRLNRPEISGLLSRDDIAFICYCCARRPDSRSQIMQDLWVCFELGEKIGGFFVEFGATNGITNSNTWLLEKKYGWNGILTEPNPIWFSDLSVNRSALIDRRCVYSESGKTVRFITTNESDPELSAMANFSTGDHFAELRRRGSGISVETVSLNDLLDQYQAPQEIDYMSIDTEGSEFEILSTFDFTKRRAKLISVEQNVQTEPALQDLLRKNGYLRVFPHLSQWDGWYVFEGIRRRAKDEIVAPGS